jgi:MFS family permease
MPNRQAPTRGPGGAAEPAPPAFLTGTAGVYAADMAMSLVLTWAVLALSHQPALAAAALLLNQLPRLAVGVWGPERAGGRLPPAAWLGLLGAAVAAMAWAARPVDPTGLRVAALMAAGMVEGWADGLAVPVSQAWWMAVTPRDRRVQASRDYELASRVPRLLAPLLSGILLATGHLPEALLAVAAAVGVSAVLWRGMPAPPLGSGPQKAAAPQSVAVLREDRWLREALALRAIGNLLWPAYSIGLPWLVLTRLHLGPAVYGVALTLYTVGTLVLTAVSGRFSLDRLRAWYGWAWAVTGVGFAALAVAPDAVWALAASAFIGAGSPPIHMALDSHIGREVPLARQPGMFAFQRLVMSAMQLAGLSAVGAVTTVLGVSPVLAAAGSVIAAAGLAMTLLDGRRKTAADPSLRPGR